MRYSICNEIFEGWELEKLCSFISELGYQGIEIAPFTFGESPTDLSPVERENAARIIRRAGLECTGLHWLLARTSGYHLTSSDPQVLNRTVEYLIALGQLCADIGGQVMVLGSPQQRSFDIETGQKKAIDNATSVLERVVPELEKLQVILALEPLGPAETNFLNTASEAAEIVQAFGSSSLQLILDVKAMATEAMEIPQLIHDNSPWISHFHANDPNRLGPGMGKINFVPILQALHEIRYNRWISVEVFDFTPGPEAIARTSIRNLLAAESP